MPNETSKCEARRRANGEFNRYFRGRGIDVCCGDDPLTPDVVKWDRKHGAGDAQELRDLPDAYFDFVYSSHGLEHMVSVERALTNWVRVLRPGGYLYVVVPDWDLYEKRVWPPHFNRDHKHTFSRRLEPIDRDNHWTADRYWRWLWDLGVYRITDRLEDDWYDYGLGDVDQTKGRALSQICFIGVKGGP